MEQRERLIELLKGAETKVTETLSTALSLEEWLGIYADHLLANGVIVPPCKVGDTLYDITEFFDGTSHPEIYELQDVEMTIEKEKDGTYRFSYDGCYICHDTIGKTVFFTIEEAKREIERRKQ